MVCSGDCEQAFRECNCIIVTSAIDPDSQMPQCLCAACVGSQCNVVLCFQVKRLVQTAYQRAKSVLQQHDKDLHTLANALLERETMSGAQINDLLGIKSQTTVAVTGTEIVKAPATRNTHDPSQ